MAHIEKFNGLSFDTDDWKAFLYEYFSDKVSWLFFILNRFLNKIFKFRKIYLIQLTGMDGCSLQVIYLLFCLNLYIFNLEFKF